MKKSKPTPKAAPKPKPKPAEEKPNPFLKGIKQPPNHTLRVIV